MSTVVQINAVGNFGSTGKIMEGIGIIAQQRGWKSCVAYAERYSSPSTLCSYLIATKFQCCLSAVHTMLTDRHGFANVRETQRLVNWLDAIKPDVIHLHNIHSYYLNIERLFQYIREHDIPVVWTLHDCWAFTGHCSHFIKVGCEKWKTQCFDCPLTHAFPKSLYFDQSRKNFEDKKRIFCSVSNLHLVTVSRWLGDMVGMSYLKNIDIRIINNGVDFSKFKPSDSSALCEKYHLYGKDVLLGVSTDWCRAKGLYDFKILSDKLPDNYVVVLVGMTSKLIKEFEKTKILCIKQTQNVQELVEWYSIAMAVLNISYAETFGLPIVACGTPGIVYNDTALPELVDEKTGFIVEPSDIDGIISAVKMISNNGKQSYEEACIKRAHKLYDKNERYNDYVDLYEEIIRK